MVYQLFQLVSVLALTVLSATVMASGLNSSEGVISYYSDALHGNVTASGDTYDKNKMTAAHKTLPFGTRVWTSPLIPCPSRKRPQ